MAKKTKPGAVKAAGGKKTEARKPRVKVAGAKAAGKKAAGAKTSAASKPAKTASKAKGPASRSTRTRTKAATGTAGAKNTDPDSVMETMETQAERRPDGGTTADAKRPQAPNEDTAASGTEAASAASHDDDREAHSETAETASNDAKTAAAKDVRPGQRAKSGEPGDQAARPNTLVPTNAVHTTQRRLKRRQYQNRTVFFLIAATLIGILILGDQTEPPDMSALEPQIAASQTYDMDGARGDPPPRGITRPRVSGPVGAPVFKPEPTMAAQQSAAASRPVSTPDQPTLDDSDLVEMERLLARLDMDPSHPDSIVDQQTTTAIRLYQEFAGLPVDGRPSQALLADMREVVKILEADERPQ